MEATLFSLIQQKYPDIVKMWDNHDYRVSAPISLDDEPTVIVLLRNKTKQVFVIELTITPKEGGADGKETQVPAS